jgi:hypothetical protein
VLSRVERGGHTRILPACRSQPALGARKRGQSTARVELKMNEGIRIDTRSGRPSRIGPVSAGCLRRTKPFRSFLARNHQRSAPVASLRREACTTAECGLVAISGQNRIKRPDTQPGCRALTHVQPRGRLPRLLSTRGKESSGQATRAQLLQASPPALCTAPRPIEDPRQLRRDRGLPRAKQPSSVIDQKPVASQRESFEADSGLTPRAI